MKPFVLSSLLSVDQVGHHFQRHFPYLKIQISRTFGPSLTEQEEKVPLSDLNRNCRELRWMAVDPDRSVSAFETAFQYTFGLRAEVRRKSGYTWDDLDQTRYWSLRKQNRKGEEIAAIYDKEYKTNLTN